MKRSKASCNAVISKVYAATLLDTVFGVKSRREMLQYWSCTSLAVLPTGVDDFPSDEHSKNPQKPAKPGYKNSRIPPDHYF